jgi:hypothetical protein
LIESGAADGLNGLERRCLVLTGLVWCGLGRDRAKL